jgi:pimeloyl-ACP methyl ester carboxylesterase
MQFEIPTPSTTFDVQLDDGARIRMRRHGNPDGVRLLITHGNGFAADAYYPYWQHLLSKFDLLVFDFRNHGQNVPVTPSNHHYAQLSRDLEQVVQEVRAKLGAKKTAGIFHSMSARTAMKHAIEIGWRWDALVLFDPPNVPPHGHPQYAAMEIFENKLTAWAKGRRWRFAAIEELTEEYKQSRGTRNWVEGEHELMARSVLRQSPVGKGYELACAPENEAAIYAQALTRHIGEPSLTQKSFPMENLYYLWSVERVAMLYDLKTIGGKDWYGWGAQVLVVHQRADGGWSAFEPNDRNLLARYPGSDNHTVTACLALLFLRRSNLVHDLTENLRLHTGIRAPG